MFSWDKDNLACKYTWSALGNLNELGPTFGFKESGTITINALNFWGDLASKEVRKNNAAMLASKIDKYLIGTIGAQRRNSSAVANILTILNQGGDALVDLAEVIDGNYDFKEG